MKNPKIPAARRMRAAGLIFLGLLFIAASAAARGEVEDVVKLEVVASRDGFHPGEAVDLAIVAEIASGWHIHDPEPADMFLIPTEIQLEPSDDFTLRETAYPDTVQKKYDYSDSELAVYLGTVVFGVRIDLRAGLAEGEYPLRGVLKYQACDQTSCLPPAEVEFEIVVRLVPASEQTQAFRPDVFEKIRFKK